MNGYVPKHKGKANWKTVPLAQQPQERDKPRFSDEHLARPLFKKMARLLKGKRIRPVSKKRQKTTAEYRLKAARFVLAAVKRGEVCPVVNGIQELKESFKYGHPTSDLLSEVHHRRGRVGRLLLDERYWMAVSKLGHRFIHANPKIARERGWLCAQGDWNKQP